MFAPGSYNNQHAAPARTTALFKINSGNRDRTNTFNGWSSVRHANRLTAAATCNHGNKKNKAKQQNQNQQNNKIKTNNATTSKTTIQKRQKNIKTKTPKMLIFFFLFDERNVLQNVHKKTKILWGIEGSLFRHSRLFWWSWRTCVP